MGTAPAPAPAATHPARVGLQVDTSALGDGAGPVRRQVEDRARALWLEAEILPARDDHDPVLRLEIAPIAGAEDSFRLRGAITGTQDAEPPTERLCELCTETELVDAAARILAELLPKAARAPTRPAQDPAASSQPETATPDQAPAARDTPAPARRPGLGPLGKAGIAVGVVGLAALATGAGLAAAGSRTSDGGSNVVDYRPAGYGLLATGGAALVTGIALLVVDRVRARKSVRSTAWAPMLMPSFAGITVAGRF